VFRLAQRWNAAGESGVKQGLGGRPPDCLPQIVRCHSINIEHEERSFGRLRVFFGEDIGESSDFLCLYRWRDNS